MLISIAYSRDIEGRILEKYLVLPKYSPEHCFMLYFLFLEMGQEVVCFCTTLFQKPSTVQLFLLFMALLFYSQAIFPQLKTSFAILHLLLSILKFHYNSPPSLPPFPLYPIPPQTSPQIISILSHPLKFSKLKTRGDH